MKKLMVTILLATAMCVPVQKANAQLVIAEIIKAGVKKVIKAVDLQIQRQQNKVVWLQNAQKVMENTMSKMKLDEITDWTERQRSLYAGYFDELGKVRAVIATYRKVKEITQTQLRLVDSYKHAWALLSQDKHFTAVELQQMQKVYTGILEASVRNLDQLYMAVNTSRTQMSDAARLKLIDDASESIDENYRDLQSYNRGNSLLSLQRAKSLKEVELIKAYYGIK